MAIIVGPTLWQYENQFSLGETALGGGNIIYKSGSGVAWIVAPASSEVSRNWYNRNDAVTTAESNAPCGDWFVPTLGRLQNPGYECRQWWDSYSSSIYWSNTDVYGSGRAWRVSLYDGSTSCTTMTTSFRVRAFRCVTY